MLQTKPHFKNGLWADIIKLFIFVDLSNQIRFVHMPCQLCCRDMCTIGSWCFIILQVILALIFSRVEQWAHKLFWIWKYHDVSNQTLHAGLLVRLQNFRGTHWKPVPPPPPPPHTHTHTPPAPHPNTPPPPPTPPPQHPPPHPHPNTTPTTPTPTPPHPNTTPTTPNLNQNPNPPTPPPPYTPLAWKAPTFFWHITNGKLYMDFKQMKWKCSIDLHHFLLKLRFRV